MHSQFDRQRIGIALFQSSILMRLLIGIQIGLEAALKQFLQRLVTCRESANLLEI